MSADIERRRAWASAHIRTAKTHGDVPRYGTFDWHNLPPTDPRRWAAVIIAGECWAVDGDDIPGRLAREIADLRRAAEQLDNEAFAVMAAGVRHRAGQPSFAELQERRYGPRE